MKAKRVSHMLFVNTAFGRGRPKGYWRDAAGLLLLMALGVGAGFADLRLGGAGLPAAVMMVFCSGYIWYRWVAGALMQNTPANAQLVPGLNRRLRRASAPVWCVCMAPLALMAPQLPSGSALVLVAGMLVTVCGASLARSASYVPGVLVGLTLVAGPPLLAWPAARIVLSHPLVLVALFLLCLGCAIYTVHTLFPIGGDRHMGMAARQEIVESQFGGAALHKIKGGSGRPHRWYARTLRGDLARPAAPGVLMLHALGPSGPPWAFVPMMAMQFGVAVLLGALVSWLGGNQFLGAFAFISYLYAGQAVETSRMTTAFTSTASEQALVRLSPAAPKRADFNLAIATQMLKGRSLQWIFGGAALFALLAPGELTTLRVLQACSLMLCTLPLALASLRDYAVMPETAPKLSAMQALGFFCLLAYCIALMLATGHPLRWSALVLALLAATAGLGMYRWRIMMAAPPAFPACRAALAMKS